MTLGRVTNKRMCFLARDEALPGIELTSKTGTLP